MSGKRRAAPPAKAFRVRQPADPSVDPLFADEDAEAEELEGRTWKQWTKLIALWSALLGVLCFLLGAGAFAYLYQTMDIPNPNEAFTTETTKVYYSDGKTVIGKFTYEDQDREIVELEKIPETMRDAVVAAENQSFWTDKGIDPKGILRAAFSNATSEETQGASTITQQYVKILFLQNERTLKRKIKEALISIKLQRTKSKSDILEGYLNTIYFGRGAYGVQAASRAFFRKPIQQITLPEAAVLASVLNQPNGAMDPLAGDDKETRKAAKERLTERYNYVLSSMAKVGTISEEEADKHTDKLPKFPKIPPSQANAGQKGHIMALVRNELKKLGYEDDEIDGGGLKIVTTLTPEAMKAAEEGVLAERPEGIKDKKLHIGVASVQVGTGELLGFYGGQDFLKSQINWAATGGMVGSTMKPFCLAAGIDAGFSLRDTFQGESPFEFPDGLLVNNEGTGPDGLGNDYGEQVDGIYAMQESINTAFVDLSDSMGQGPERIVKMANEMGVPPSEADEDYPGIPSTSVDLDPQDTLVTLGKARISPINMANAYATIANEGVRSTVHVVKKVVDKNGGNDWEFKAQPEYAVDPEIAADVSYAMQQVVNAGTGRAALGLGRPAAGKTGTATKEGKKDEVYVSSAWFVGFTPQVSTAVMYVRGDGDNQLDGWLPEYFGGSYPARTWTSVMTTAMEGQEVLSFPPPVYVDGDAPEEGHDPWAQPTPEYTETPEPTDPYTPPPTEPPPTEPTLPTDPMSTPTTPPAEARGQTSVTEPKTRSWSWFGWLFG